ncbi:MAG: serine/threonine-protein kinase [Clostridiaceae bacterium]
MTETIADEFLKVFDESRFPRDFLQMYEPMECMAHNQMGETLLVRDRQTGSFFVAKCYADQSLFSSRTESELLKDLHHEGLPAFIGEYQNEAVLCVVREYAEGLPLDKYVRNGSLSEQQIISIGVQLCDILAHLHGHMPPIIHRDIKPQNIIIDQNGKVKLIDFGISRVYNKEAKADTVFFGTQEFSPPEQYGFSQTDCRSDIFSLGVVLLWMLTGETGVEAARDKVRNKRLYHVVRKCTAFAPKDRYAGAEAVKRALLRSRPVALKRDRILSAVAGVLAVALCVTGGVMWHNYNSREIFTEDHIPAYITSKDLVEESVEYLNEKYATDLFAASDEITNMGYVRKLLAEVFGYDKEYAYAMPPEDSPYPHESESNFFPWGLPETESVPKDVMTYTAVKIFWPDVITDYSSLKDDNGVYPGVRVATTFAEEHGILNGINRPAHLTYGDIAAILANADKEKQSEK